MFTGIVQSVGTVLGAGPRLRLRGPVLDGTPEGGSVAVDGCCLTAVTGERDERTFDLSPETVARTTLGGKRAGDRVNLERPLRVGDELGGHLVQGHIDCVGRVTHVDRTTGHVVTIAIDPAVGRYVAAKGSVTVDGVSLTVTEAGPSAFSVALIPHTLAVTTLGELGAGNLVNVETDMLARHVERLLAPWLPGAARMAGVEGGADSEYL